MSAYNVYSYVTASGQRTFADSPDIQFTGTWASDGTYTALAKQAVDYSQSQHICVTDCVGQNPTTQPTRWRPTRYWSPLVLAIATEGTESKDLTFQIASLGSNIAVRTLEIATAGSNAAVAVTASLSALNADSVIYGRNSYATLGDVADALLYVPLTVSSMTNNVGTVEVGSTVNSVNLAWSFNKAVTSQSINQGVGALDASLRAYTVSGARTSGVTFTLTASDGNRQATASTSVSFAQKRYWGASALTALNDAQVIALNNEFSGSRSQSRTFVLAGQYIYFAYPDSLGAATFTVNGLLNSAWTLAQRTFVNASGYSESYRIYRSNNLVTGTVQVTVS